MTDEQSKQLINLEIKVAHQDHIIEELSEALYKQQLRMDHFEKTLSDLQRRIQSEQAGDQEIRPHEKPPHY